jgi:hypothetical protein
MPIRGSQQDSGVYFTRYEYSAGENPVLSSSLSIYDRLYLHSEKSFDVVFYKINIAVTQATDLDILSRNIEKRN